MKRIITVFSSLIVCLLCSNSAADTDVVLYRPFSQAPGQATLKSSSAIKGECLTHSRKSPRDDAWRCIAKGKIFDPCFVRTYVKRNQVVCPDAPWSERATTIELSEHLPQPEMHLLDTFKQQPWIIELSNGDKCFFNKKQGQTQFQCQQQGSIIGDIQRCKDTWQVQYQALNQQSEHTTINRVWY